VKSSGRSRISFSTFVGTSQIFPVPIPRVLPDLLLQIAKNSRKKTLRLDRIFYASTPAPGLHTSLELPRFDSLLVSQLII